MNELVIDSEQKQYARGLATLVNTKQKDYLMGLVEIGEYLINMKKRLGHGNYLPALEASGVMSERQAGKYISIAAQKEYFKFALKGEFGINELAKIANAYKREGEDGAEEVVKKLTEPKKPKHEDEPIEVEIVEETKTYTKDEVMELIMRLKDGETITVDGLEFKVEMESTNGTTEEELKHTKELLHQAKVHWKMLAKKYDEDEYNNYLNTEQWESKSKEEKGRTILGGVGLEGEDEKPLNKKEIEQVLAMSEEERVEKIGVSKSVIQRATARRNRIASNKTLIKIRQGLK